MTAQIQIQRAAVAGHGVDDYESDLGDAFTLHATLDGVTAGNLDYNDRGDRLRIRWIETEPAYRRRGVAAALMGRLAHLHPGVALETGDLTDDGSELMDSLGVDIVCCRDEDA